MQVNRLFEIIYILLEKNMITAKELAERFEVSQRTIYRDIETLSTAGIPVYMSKGKGGGISILPDFILNKAILTEEEKKEILSSIRAVNAVSFSDPAPENVLRKLNNILGENDTDWIEVDFSNWGNAEREKETFNNLKSAILSKKVVKFDYSSGKGENISREVCPLKLYFKGQSWYMYGYCRIRNDYRFFKLRRIKGLCISKESFNIKAPQNIMKEDNIFNDEFVTLKMRIYPKMAYRVYDEFEYFKKLDDGSFIVTIEYPKGEWLFSYISSFGEECEVLEPQEIRKEIKNKIEKMLLNYS
ncbi:Predicted DNA-binding transcriptional regulator YafY, contains an HTH and WYL domains [Clostridium collagenovorans DSM 3089]|uniref:Predicted DNA-binding transcriptional regulator YafY, contains an HTH and WYL domains n=1 Tax=Clostridium collagenovorans DSM 3089 TaxID=1121306 RepID=A0A1M5S3X6_9CLOT|nr:YafY family protein [Clostridium collagenovorans]SHH32653.1 Predicted DNA-binding transcriptional regulator YafY, contains an HTH and WYL domains [Clostridium collagenovorans DSM 3089]